MLEHARPAERRADLRVDGTIQPTTEHPRDARGCYKRRSGGVRSNGHRAIVGDISEREVIVAILAHLGLPTEAPPVARARSPAFELS